MDAHETEVRAVAASIANGTDHDAGAGTVGCVLTSARPALSTATHRPSDGHEIARGVCPPSISMAPDQASDVVVPADGVVAPADGVATQGQTHAAKSSASRVAGTAGLQWQRTP
ncbi:MAG TPA: hypothetical protein VGY76_00990 [Solirubrobacteraceae bacterium]|nr:hypothetical protein [Solirubrobacteraceae bacterium]